VLDLSPVTVSGPITAARARVIYHDGTLAVFTAPDQVQTFPTEQPTRLRGARWSVTTEAGDLAIQKTCGCGGAGGTPLAKARRADLLALI